MYFEDIYYKIKPLWKDNFSLEGIEETETYVESIRKNFIEVEYIVDNKYKRQYTEWEGMMVFTMYKALTAFAIDKWKKKKSELLFFDEIPITVFEEYFKKGMEPEDEFEGNLEYLKKYKGFRNKM